MKNLNSFTGLYPISKTLRFELKPQGKTLEHIEKSGILENDNYRAEKYEEVKDIIDSYHKWFINETLRDLHINWTGLKDALENNRRDKSDASKKELQRVQKIKREEIYNALYRARSFSVPV